MNVLADPIKKINHILNFYHINNYNKQHNEHLFTIIESLLNIHWDFSDQISRIS